MIIAEAIHCLTVPAWLQSPLHNPYQQARAVQGDCERVYRGQKHHFIVEGNSLTHWALEDLDAILKMQFSNLLY